MGVAGDRLHHQVPLQLPRHRERLSAGSPPVPQQGGGEGHHQQYPDLNY